MYKFKQFDRTLERISDRNNDRAWRLLYQSGWKKPDETKRYCLHHWDKTLIDRDINRYIEWNLYDLDILTINEHARLHWKDHPLESHKGNHLSDLHKKKLSDAHKGRIVTEEWKKKISNSLKGHKVSEETRRKISEGHRKRRKRL